METTKKTNSMKTKKDQWDNINYENLTKEENNIIRTARRKGYAVFYPAFPNWQSQGINTLNGAKEYLKQTA